MSASAIDIAVRDFRADTIKDIQTKRQKLRRFDRTLAALRQRVRVEHKH